MYTHVRAVIDVGASMGPELAHRHSAVQGISNLARYHIIEKAS